MTIAGVSTSDETPPVSLVDAFVSSMTPRVRAIKYEATSYKTLSVPGRTGSNVRDSARTNRVNITNGKIDRMSSTRNVEAALSTHEPGL